MPTSFSHLVFCLFTFPLLLLQLLQNCYLYFCHFYLYYDTTLLLNTLLQILRYPGVVELTTQLLILKNILWLPLCRINKFGLNTLPLKAVAIPYTCGLSRLISGAVAGDHRRDGGVIAASQFWLLAKLSYETPTCNCLAHSSPLHTTSIHYRGSTSVILWKGHPLGTHTYLEAFSSFHLLVYELYRQPSSPLPRTRLFE